MKKKFSYDITKRAALPRSERLRNVGVTALTAKSFAVETGNWLPREEFDNLFEPVYNEEGGISHILAKYTLLSLGDLQSKKYAEIGGGGNFSIMSSWDASLAADPEFVLSAGLGYDLYLNKLGKSEAEGLYQPKGNYALASALGDYVTKNTAQEITATKSFRGASLKLIGSTASNGATRNTAGVLAFQENNYDDQFGIWGYFSGTGTGQKLFIGGSGSGASLGNDQAGTVFTPYLTIEHTTGNLTVLGKIIKQGGTSAQFLMADGSVKALSDITSAYISSIGVVNTAASPYNYYTKNGENVNFAPAALKGNFYISGGLEKPNAAMFGSGTLRLQMLHTSNNLGLSNSLANGAWADVLWLSSYTGNDVKNSHALVMPKGNHEIFLFLQNYDSASWDSTPARLLSDLNFASILDNRYVKKSGDTMTGVLYFGGSNCGVYAADSFWLAFKAADGLDKLVIGSDVVRRSTQTANVSLGSADIRWSNLYANTINVSSNALVSNLNADLLDGLHASDFVRFNGDARSNFEWLYKFHGYAYSANDPLWRTYGPAMGFGANASYHKLIQGTANLNDLYMKTCANGVYTAWREFAFTDSNVASATKLQTSRNFSVADYYGDHTGAAVGFDGTAAVTLKLPEDVNVRNLIGQGSVTAKNGLIAADDTYGGLYAYGGAASYRARIWARRLNGSWGTDDIWVDVDSNGKSIFYHPVEIRGDVVVKGTILATDDVQSKKAGPNYDEVVRITLTGSDETVSIPASASEAIITVWGDGWTKTIQLTGDINDLDVLKLTIYDYGGMGDTWKYGNTSFTVTSGKGNVLALVRMSSTSVRFMKLI